MKKAVDAVCGLSPRGRGNPQDAENCRSNPRSIPAWAGQPVPPEQYENPQSVYPRVGGATALAVTRVWVTTGLSPRGRGNLDGPRTPNKRPRSIPAWAGQPPGGRPSGPPSAVYPRVGGATQSISAPTPTVKGLSPRGRGIMARRRSPRALLALGSVWLGMARSGGGVVDAGSIADSSSDVLGDAEGKP